MNILDIAIAKKLAGGGGGSGTDNYNDLSNLPKINDVTLSGNKTSANLGLQSEINSDSKLASDLVDDTNQDNKFVTSTEKNTWNAKQNAIDADHKINADYVDDSTSTNKFVTASDKEAWNAKQNAIDNSHKLSSDLVDDANHTNKFVTSTEKNTWNAKQNAIDSDHKLSSSLVSFTTAEAAALASGIDSEKVAQISTNQTNISSLQSLTIDFFDSVPGSTDTDKINYVFEHMASVTLDRDIQITSATFKKDNVYINGNGHTIYISGKITCDKLYGQNYFFDNCIIDGTGGGQFLNLNEEYFLNVRFTNCYFINFPGVIFSGNFHGYKFYHCTFNNNANWVMASTRIDRVTFSGCNVENHSTSFLKVHEFCYQLTVRDTIIEGLTDGKAFELNGLSDGIFDGLYMEENAVNFEIYKDFCGNATFKNIHMNSSSNTTDLITLKEKNGGKMYGTFVVENCGLQRGRLIHMSGTHTYGATCSITCRNNMINNNSDIDPFYWDDVVRGLITSSDTHSEELHITGAFTTQMFELMNMDCRAKGHQIILVAVKRIENSDRTQVITEPQYYNTFVLGDNNQFKLNGEGTETYHYFVTVLYK